MSTPTSQPQPKAQGPQQWSTRQTITVVLLCGALFLDSMNTSSINVAVPTIGSQLHMSPSALQWVVSGYLLGFGGFLLLGGRASDLLGRRRIFLGALVMFGAASLVGGLVDSGTLLIAAGFIKGVAAAFTIPAGLSILTTTFTKETDTHKALGAWGATGAAGFTLGLVIGGLLSQLGWRYVYLIPAPLAALLVIVGLRVLEHAAPPTAPDRRQYDLPGAIAITASMMLLVYSVVEAPTRGWLDGPTIGGLVLSALLLAAFIMIEKRSAAPLMRLGILKHRALASADLAGMLYFGSFLGFQFLATLYVQDVAGWSPVETSLAFLPVGSFLLLGGPLAPQLISRFGTKRLIAAGLLCWAAGYALFLREQSHHLTYVTMLLPSMVLIGVGWAVAFPALNVQATAGVAGREQGLAAGLFNTTFQVGGAIGVAVVTAVIASHVHAAGGEPQAVIASIRPALAILIPVALAGIVALLAISGTGADLPELVTTESEQLAPAEGSEAR